MDVALRARLTAREGRQFAFTVGVAFLLVGGISAWRGHHLPPRILWTLGGLLLLSGAVIPSRLGPVYRAWMWLGHTIGRVVSPVVIGAMYFLVITPTGVVLRLLGRNPLRHREVDGGFWMPASSDGRSDLETQF